MHLRAGGGGGDAEKWFQIQDLIVEEVRKEMIFLGETVLQVRALGSIYSHFFINLTTPSRLLDLGEEGTFSFNK